jgi:hypothetical protein
MQLLHPPLRCSKQMQIILVTGRKHIDASAFTNIFVPGRWWAKRTPETLPMPV